ncbi:MAG: PAS domain S-box protein [Spirochaetes bacterium]|nr:PAS domain S-box protein [Spirochaetota bacterium]
MDKSTVIALVNNAALLLSLTLFYNITNNKFFNGKSKWHQLFNGLVLGTICILVMLNPWVLVSGIVFDTRSILISTSGLFFGIIPTFLAVFMGAVYRFYLGGSGVWAGIAVMAVSGALGLVWRYLNKKNITNLSWVNLYLFGVVVHISMLLLMISLPGIDPLYVLKNVGLPVILLFPLGTVLLSKLLIRQHEREKMAIALQRSESILKETQQITKAGGWEYDLRTDRIFWTDEVYHIYEVFRDDYDPDNIAQDISFYAPEDRPIIENAYNRAVSEGIPYDLTLRFRSAKGNALWVRTIGKAETKNGKVMRVYGNIADVTESIQAKQALAESRERFKRAQEIAHLGNWELDLTNNRLIWSDEVHRIFGFSPNEFAATYEAFLDAVHPDDREAVNKAYLDSLGKGSTGYETEHRIIRKTNGEVRYVREKCEHEKDQSGKVIRSFGMILDVTDSMLASLNLKHSEAQYRSLAESSPDSIVRFDRQYRHLYVNRAAAKIWNHSPEEDIGKTLREVGIPMERALKLEACIDAVFRTGQMVNSEGAFETSYGFRYFNIKFVPEVMSDGSFVSVISISRDITEHKLAEEQLLTEKQRFYNVLENMPMMVCLLTPDYHVAFRNRAFREKFGESHGRHCYEYCFGNTEPCGFCEAYRVLETGEPHRWEATIGDNATIIDVYDFPFYDADGTPMILEVNVDITERKKAYEELKKYHDNLEELVRERTDELIRGRNMLRTLIDSLPDEIYAKDKENRFIMANLHVLNNYGLSHFKNILGKTDFDFLPREEAEKTYANEYSLLQHDGKIINYEDHIINTSGKERWVEVTKIPMRDRDGNIMGIVGINRDITEYKKIEKNLVKAKEAAEIANRAKSTFLSRMSHEIRTPLNAILGFSELMQHDNGVSEKNVKWLKTINQSGEHLLALINDILELSRIEAGRITYNPVSFDLLSLLNEIEAMFRVKTESKDLTLFFYISEDLPRCVVSDEGKLRQILINLIGNAVKFTKEGGITLRAYGKQEGDKYRITIEVEDTGPGIAEKDIAKVFQKFGQTEEGIKEGGTGLGLAISQEYAKIMGGELVLL